MATTNEVKITITGDKKKLKKTLDDGEKDLGGFKAKVGDWAKKLGAVAVAGIAALGAATIAGGAALFKLGGEFDDVYDTIRIGTGATGDALEGLQDSAKNVLKSVPTDFESVGTAIADVNTRLDLSGGQLETVASQYIRLTDMMGGDLAKNIESGSQALKQFKVPADQSDKALDHLFKVAQSTGIGFDELSNLMSKNGAVLQSLGYDFNSSASLIGQLEKAGVDVTGTLAGMGKGLATLAKAGESPKDAFARLTGEIATMKDPIAASQKAIELFGSKGGAKLAAELRSGALNVDAFNQSIEANRETILGVGAETDDWKEKLEVLKNKVLVALEPAAMKVFDAVGDVVEKATPTVERFATWIGEKLPPFLKTAGDKAAELGRAASTTLLPPIRSVGGFVADTLMPALVKFGGWIASSKPALVTIGGIIGTVLVAAFVAWAVSAGAAAIATLAALAPIIAVVAAVGLVVAALVLAYNKWDLFHNVVNAVAGFLTKTLWPILKQVVTVIATSLVAAVGKAADMWRNVLWPALKTVADFISQRVWPVIQGIANVFQAVGAVVVWVIGGIVSAVIGIGQRIAGPISTLWNGLTWGITVAKNVVVSIVDKIVDVVKGIGRRIGDVAGVLKAPFQVAFDGIKSIWNSTIGGLSISIPDIPGFPGRGKRISFPKMHSGGVVGDIGRREQLTVLEAGETVRAARQEAELQSILARFVAATSEPAQSAAAPVTVDLRGAVLTNDMAKTILDLVESAVAAGHRPTRLAAVLR